MSSNGMTTLNLSHSIVPIFNGENYVFWSIKMKKMLISQVLWDLVENEYSEMRSSKAVEKIDVKELCKKDEKTLLVLQ